MEKIDSLTIKNFEADERIEHLEHETEFQLDELNKIIVSYQMVNLAFSWLQNKTYRETHKSGTPS